jgi:purine catabolism regulator
VPDPHANQTRLSMVLERAAQALELGRMVERDRFGLAVQAHSGLLSELSAGRVPDEASARARATSLGLAPADRYVAAVGVPARDPRAPGPSPVSPHLARALVEKLSTGLRAAGLSGLVGTLSSRQVGVLLAVPRGRTAEQTLDALVERLAAGEVVLGAGPAAPGVVAAGAGIRQAAHVAEVASAMPDVAERRWFRAVDVRLRGLLTLLHDDPRLQAFVEAELGPLLEHEARRGDGMLDLLREYVAVGGSKTRLARATHRSRPALYKKLARLERILGVDLDEPMSWMSIGVAVTAYDQARRLDDPAR